MPIGITFNDEKHSYRDFGLRIISVNIGLPEVKKSLIDIPGADGYVDMTDYFGTRYENRKIKVECDFEDKGYSNWAARISDISNYLHGKPVKLIFDFDEGYYYDGRGECEYEKSNRRYGKITLTFDCKPYKLDLLASDEDWLWDPFDFETGVIREYGSIAVNGTYDLVVDGSPMPVIPKIECSAAMKVLFEGVEYALSAGLNYITDILIGSGEYRMQFSGKGTVTVIYRGGSL